MKSPFKEIVGIILVIAFMTLLSYGLNYLQKPNALENIEKRLDEAEQQQKVLTEKEKELVQDAQNKEWEEVDKETDK